MQELDLEDALAQVEEALVAKEHEKVVELCDALEGRFPDEFKIYYYRARSKRAQSDVEGAIKDLSRAIALEPREPGLFFLRGVWTMSAGDHRAALVDMQSAIERDEALGSTYYRDAAKFARAVAFLLLGDAEQALRECVGLPENMTLFLAGRVWTMDKLRERAAREGQA